MKCYQMPWMGTRMSLMMRFFNQKVDEYLDNMLAKNGKGSGGQKNVIQDKSDDNDLTKMIADLKK